MNKKGMLVVLSAPSGCGKDTVYKELTKLRQDICESVSVTTRSPREGEIEGINYYFKTVEQFKELIENEGLLEYTLYNNCYYGTPVEGVEKAIEQGKICFSIFLLPPSLEVLEHRLNNRKTNDQEDIKRRMELAGQELELAHLYDYVVVNDALDNAVNEINEILNNELSARN